MRGLPSWNGWSADSRWISIFSPSLARSGAAGRAGQTRIRIIEVTQAMTSEAADPHAHVQLLCALAGLPRATYYRHLNRCRRDEAECELRDQLQRICLKHPFYGYRWVTANASAPGNGRHAKKVLKLMRRDNLLAQRKTPFLKPPSERPTNVIVVPNLIRGLAPSAPDQIWVADITYVHLAKTFAYLAVILDGFSGKAVGWAFENTPASAFQLSRPCWVSALCRTTEYMFSGHGGSWIVLRNATSSSSARTSFCTSAWLFTTSPIVLS